MFGKLMICGVALLLMAAQARAETIEEKVQVCAGCHGENGKPVDKTIPTIWGQQAGYLYIQLRDFKRGDRKNEIMQPIAAQFERDDMLAIAEYFSQKPWPDLSQPRAPKDVAEKAVSASRSVGCPACHLDRFQGDGTVPRLAGMGRDYLAKTIADFRTRARGNNPGMSDLMLATSPDDLAALVDYLAGL
ncbi:cytochrome c553 [Bradyrhizobium sp. USDA 4503]|uniref:c-type cytochrome n=1 Tax=Bradyrhizobium brasilense TaxID=1419277 RepID=UPI001E2A3F87|nr:c-type cytochrome [Bradyrhizobium brasilense]